ncbi:hypothetical protein FKM82_029444 [Ascaphus truei]
MPAVVQWRLFYQQSDSGFPSLGSLVIPRRHHKQRLLGGDPNPAGGVHGTVRAHLEVRVAGLVPDAFCASAAAVECHWKRRTEREVAVSTGGEGATVADL